MLEWAGMLMQYVVACGFGSVGFLHGAGFIVARGFGRVGFLHGAG